MNDRARHMDQGWEISDVERLIGLSRRYIQRACYAGKDGAGILAPETNGRERLYGVRDLAVLLVVGLFRDERYSRDRQRHTLGEVRDAIAAAGGDVEGILSAQSELLRDQLEETANQYLRVRALAAALDADAPGERLANLLDEISAVAVALGPDAGAALLGMPGFELAQELRDHLRTVADGVGVSEQHAEKSELRSDGGTV